MSKLQAVRELLTDPAHWLQGEYSDDPDKPTCFCLNGAVAHVEAFLPRSAALDAHPLIQTLAALINDDPEDVAPVGASKEVARWNDAADRTHDEVLQLLDKALETQNA